MNASAISDAEARVRVAEAEVRKLELEVRKAEIDADVRKAEIDADARKAEIEDRKAARAEAKAKRESESFIARGEFLRSS